MFLQGKDVDAMDLTNDVYNAVDRYFSVLKHTGYKAYNEVEKLIAYIFIEEFLTGPLSVYITEEDYNIISNSLYCLYGTCMIPYPDYMKSADSIVSKLHNYRYTEDEILRAGNNYEVRVKS